MRNARATGRWRDIISGRCCCDAMGDRMCPEYGGRGCRPDRGTRRRGHALAGTIDDYELSFESGERLRGRFLVTRLDYAGDYNGERNYTLNLESSGAVASL